MQSGTASAPMASHNNARPGGAGHRVSGERRLYGSPPPRRTSVRSIDTAGRTNRKGRSPIQVDEQVLTDVADQIHDDMHGRDPPHTVDAFEPVPVAAGDDGLQGERSGHGL